MVSELVLKVRAGRIPDETKSTIIKGYVLSQYEVLAVDGGEAYILTDEGKELAEYLIKQEKWKKVAEEFRVEFLKTETLH